MKDQSRTNDELIRRAEERIQSNPHLAGKEISCAIVGSALVLRGRLSSYYLKQVAQVVVSQLDGVGSIDNQIEIMPPAGQ